MNMTPLNQPHHLIFAGGGTAGHLFPGLAVAEQVTQLAPGVSVTFAGSGKPLERRAVRAAGFEYVPVASHPLPGSASEAVRFVWQNWHGFRAASTLLQDRRAALVVGLGGFASVPMARAAIRHRVPLVLLEQNLVPGRATRWLAPSAARICTAFQETRQQLQAVCPVRCVGNPLRKGFGHLAASAGAPAFLERPRRLLVLGGSQGSASLNEFAPKALHHLRAHLANWEIVHQSGDAGRAATERLYAKLDLPAQVIPFIDDLPQQMHSSQLAISRAGGTTLAELAASGLPAVLVPYPHATDDHQRVNARYFQSQGAAALFDVVAKAASPRALADMMAPMVADEAKRSAMSAAMQSMARVEAAWHVANMLLELGAVRQAPRRPVGASSRPGRHHAASAL